MDNMGHLHARIKAIDIDLLWIAGLTYAGMVVTAIAFRTLKRQAELHQCETRRMIATLHSHIDSHQFLPEEREEILLAASRITENKVQTPSDPD